MLMLVVVAVVVVAIVARTSKDGLATRFPVPGVLLFLLYGPVVNKNPSPWGSYFPFVWACYKHVKKT